MFSIGFVVDKDKLRCLWSVHRFDGNYYRCQVYLYSVKLFEGLNHITLSSQNRARLLYINRLVARLSVVVRVESMDAIGGAFGVIIRIDAPMEGFVHSIMTRWMDTY